MLKAAPEMLLKHCSDCSTGPVAGVSYQDHGEEDQLASGEGQHSHLAVQLRDISMLVTHCPQCTAVSLQDHGEEDQPASGEGQHSDLPAQLGGLRAGAGGAGHLHGPQPGHAAQHL